MSNLSQIAKSHLARLPEVAAIVVTDGAGALLESTGDVDGEALGAVHVVALQVLAQCGEDLGLGPIQRISMTSAKRTCVIVPHDGDVLGVYLDPAKPLAAFEKQLEATLRR